MDKQQQQQEDEPDDDDDEKPTKEQKTDEEDFRKDERARLLQKLERLILHGAIKKEHLEVLKESKEIINFLHDIQKLDTLELKVMISLLKQQIIGSGHALGDPIQLIQRMMARGGGYIKGSTKIEERIEKDVCLTMALDDLMGDHLDNIPAIIRVGTALISDLIDIEDDRPIFVALPATPEPPKIITPEPVPSTITLATKNVATSSANTNSSSASK